MPSKSSAHLRLGVLSHDGKCYGDGLALCVPLANLNVFWRRAGVEDAVLAQI